MTEFDQPVSAYPAWAMASALLAGIASSASPCAIAALPLVIGYVGGSRWRAFGYAAAFVLGMALTFTAAAVAMVTAGVIFGPAGHVWQVVMAALAIIFGGHLLGVWRLPGLGQLSCALPPSRWALPSPAVCPAWFSRPVRRRFWLLAGGLIALAGVGFAGFQSWEQWYPELAGGCTGAEPGLIERLVEWLGIRWPRLFMATGFCESKELVILGLSLANWSFLAYAGFASMTSSILFYPSNSRKENAS